MPGMYFKNLAYSEASFLSARDVALPRFSAVIQAVYPIGIQFNNLIGE